MKGFFRFTIYLLGALLGVMGLWTMGTAISHAFHHFGVGSLFGLLVIIAVQAVIFGIGWIILAPALRLQSREQRAIMLLFGLLLVQLIFFILVELRPH